MVLRIVVLILTTTILLSGCGRSSFPPDDGDGGTEPALDAADGDDECCDDGWTDAGDGWDSEPADADGFREEQGDQYGDDGGLGIDVDIGEGFGLVVPAGTQVCAKTWSVGIFDIYRTRGRLTFREGLVRLPLDQVGFDLDWIEKIEFGPEKTVLASIGPGTFTRYIEGTESDGYYRYEYRQSFDLHGEPYEVVYQVRFLMEGGVAVDPVLVFNEEYLSSLDGHKWLNLFGFFSVTRKQYFATCSGELYRRIYHDIVLDNGDILHFEQRMQRLEDSNACLEACPATVARAVFRRGQEVRVVTDVFRLAYTDGQHNWWQEYLVVFDQPVDSVFGIYMAEEELGLKAKKVNYLDSNLNIIESVDISNYQASSD